MVYQFFLKITTEWKNIDYKALFLALFFLNPRVSESVINPKISYLYQFGANNQKEFGDKGLNR